MPLFQLPPEEELPVKFSEVWWHGQHAHRPDTLGRTLFHELGLGLEEPEGRDTAGAGEEGAQPVRRANRVVTIDGVGPKYIDSCMYTKQFITVLLLIKYCTISHSNHYTPTFSHSCTWATVSRPLPGHAPSQPDLKPLVAALCRQQCHPGSEAEQAQRRTGTKYYDLSSTWRARNIGDSFCLHS